MPTTVVAVLVMCSLTTAAGCGSDDKQSTVRARAPKAKPKPSADLATRVVPGDEMVGFPVLAGVGNEVRTNPGAFVGDSPGLYADEEKAIAGLRRDGFIAGITKHFQPGAVGAADSTAVQMRAAHGAVSQAAAQLSSATAPCAAAPKCVLGSRRFSVPGIPGASGIDVTHAADAEVLREAKVHSVHDISIIFVKGPFIYNVFAGGPQMNQKKRAQLIAASRALYERVSTLPR